MRAQPLLVASLVLLAVLPHLAPASAAPSWSVGRNDFFVEMSDGVHVDATLWVPEGTPPGARLPAIVVVHGYGGSKEAGSARDAAERGFVGFAYSTRGFGESGGRMDLVGPRSMQDLRELLAWLPANAPVDAERIGFVGASHGGGHALMAATDPDIDLAAVVAIAAWSDLERGLIPNGAPKLSYLAGFYATGMGIVQDGDEPEGFPALFAGLGRRCVCDSYAPEIHRWFVEMATGVGSDDLAAGLAERSAIHRAANTRAPVFLIQGLNDDLFPGDEAIEMFERIPHSEKRLHLGFVGHPRAVASGPEIDHLLGEVFEWFDHYLRGVGPRPFDPAAPVEVASSPWTGDVERLARWTRGEEGDLFRFTPAGGLVAGGSIDGGALPIVNTLAAGVPDDGALTTFAPAAADAPDSTPADTRVFRSGPLAEARTLLGTPRAELSVASSSGTHMVAVKIFDRAPDGSTALVTRGVFVVEDGLPAVPLRLAFDLQPYHHLFEAGHEIEVRVSASDSPAFAPVKTPFTTLVHVGADGGSGVRLPLS